MLDIIPYKLPNKMINDRMFYIFNKSSNGFQGYENILIKKHIYKFIFIIHHQIDIIYMVTDEPVEYPIHHLLTSNSEDKPIRTLIKSGTGYSLSNINHRLLNRYPIIKNGFEDDFSNYDEELILMSEELYCILNSMYETKLTNELSYRKTRYIDDRMGLSVLRSIRKISKIEDIDNVVISLNIFNEAIIQLYKQTVLVRTYYLDFTCWIL